MGLFVRIAAFVTRRPLVWLRDHDGEITLTLAKRSPWGDLTAERWWPFTGLHTVTLADDGSCPNGSYVRQWKYAKERQP